MSVDRADPEARAAETSGAAGDGGSPVPVPPLAHRELTGWGRTAPTASTVAQPAWLDEITASIRRSEQRGTIARGLGRGYGDAAQNAGGLVIDTTGTARFELDPETGVVRADAGVSLDRLMRTLMPRGSSSP